MGALLRTAPWWLVAACALAATGVATGAQLAISSAGAPVVAGGDSIATATALPVETRVANTNRRPEYWRVDLGLADELVVDLGSTNRRFSVEVCVLDPEVNDYSADGAPCRAQASTNTKRQLRFVAPARGSWISVVLGCTGCTLYRPLGASYAAYEFTAYVRRYTRVTLLTPARVRVGRPLVVRGAVEGAGSGPLQIVRRSAGRWVPLGATQIQSGGTFRYATTLYKPGVVEIRALYSGDDGHRPSSETKAVTVR